MFTHGSGRGKMHKIVSFLGMAALAGSFLMVDGESTWADGGRGAGRRATARRSA